MIDKFIKISQIFALSLSILSFNSISAEELSLSDDQKEELASDVRDLGKQLEQMIENGFQERHFKTLQYVNSNAFLTNPIWPGGTWPGSSEPLSNFLSGMGYNAFQQNAVIAFNPNPTIPNAIDNLPIGNTIVLTPSGIYFEATATFKNIIFRGFKIFLLHEHAHLRINNTPNINIHTRISVRDMKCYVDFDQLYNIASFSGESVTNSKTVDLTKFTEFGLDRADFLKKCKRVKMTVPAFFGPPKKLDLPIEQQNNLIPITFTGV
ncbi:MAG: hypothetical protein U1E31_00560 [Rickettsiales bacterium]